MANKSKLAKKPSKPAQPLKLSETEQNRLDNLRLLVTLRNGPAALARSLGYQNGSFIVQLAGPNPNRTITDKQARKIEIKLGLPLRIMDAPVDEDRLKREMGIDDNTVIAMGSFSLNRALQQNHKARGRLSDIVSRVIDVLLKRGDMDSKAAGKIAERVLEVTYLADVEPDTRLITRVMDSEPDKPRKTGS